MLRDTEAFLCFFCGFSDFLACVGDGFRVLDGKCSAVSVPWVDFLECDLM